MKHSILMTCLMLLGAAGPAMAEYPHQARDLAATCAGCHGTSGHSEQGMPSLAGRPAEQTLADLEAFREGEREATIMDQIARGYTDEQLRQIAEYFAAQQ